MRKNNHQPELRPCPFCGGSVTLYGGRLRDGDCIIVCDKCGAASAYFYDIDRAVRAWNRRVEDEHMS